MWRQGDVIHLNLLVELTFHRYFTKIVYINKINFLLTKFDELQAVFQVKMTYLLYMHEKILI